MLCQLKVNKISSCDGLWRLTTLAEEHKMARGYRNQCYIEQNKSCHNSVREDRLF
jgi:hypothetical protein